MSSISLRRTRKAGEPVPFDCPRCPGREGRRFATRSWLTLLGHRVTPLGRAKVFLECGRCGRTFGARALATGGPSEDEKAIRSLVAAVVMVDTRLRAPEMNVARRVLQQYGAHAVLAEDLAEELHRMRRRFPDPLRYLTRLSSVLGERAKIRIIEAIYDVCVADDELHPAETRLIRAAGEALDLSPMQVREAMRRARDDG